MEVLGADQAAMAAIVFLAYVVFGLTGLGSAMVAVPGLVHFIPLTAAVPLVLLLDMVSTVSVAARHWRRVSRAELARLLPFMAVGIALGVGALTGVPQRLLLVLLGVFVIANSAWNLWAPASRGEASRAWAAPAGVMGGVFSALFGTGGPVYASYLARRLVDDGAALRATLVTTILGSALLRVGAFASAGLYRRDLLLTWVALLPFCLAGLWAGGTLHGRLPPERARRALFLVLFAAGVTVLGRAASM